LSKISSEKDLEGLQKYVQAMEGNIKHKDGII